VLTWSSRHCEAACPSQHMVIQLYPESSIGSYTAVNSNYIKTIIQRQFDFGHVAEKLKFSRQFSTIDQLSESEFCQLEVVGYHFHQTQSGILLLHNSSPEVDCLAGIVPACCFSVLLPRQIQYETLHQHLLGLLLSIVL